MESKTFHGKVIYNPSGKAGEYSYWAANFYNGCSARCEYCYNRHGRSAKIVGGDIPMLKKTLKNYANAIFVFKIEALKNMEELTKHGLFFNFVSDPCLKETIDLNFEAIQWAAQYGITCKILTKQTWWINEFIDQFDTLNVKKEYFHFGFTLTGRDENEPGAASNIQRIDGMIMLNKYGFKTWASIEPIIDLEASFDMIEKSHNYCDLYKIGIQSGKKYNKKELNNFIDGVLLAFSRIKTPIYFKDSILKQAGIDRQDLTSNCINRDFKL
jgi:DNA repair photolyase